jgi:hypothetical protein
MIYNVGHTYNTKVPEQTGVPVLDCNKKGL